MWVLVAMVFITSGTAGLVGSHMIVQDGFSSQPTCNAAAAALSATGAFGTGAGHGILMACYEVK